MSKRSRVSSGMYIFNASKLSKALSMDCAVFLTPALSCSFEHHHQPRPFKSSVSHLHGQRGVYAAS
jgi:hypothetical protein